MPHPEGHVILDENGKKKVLPFKYGEDIVLESFQKELGHYERVKKWMADPYRENLPTDLIGDRIYIFEDLYIPRDGVSKEPTRFFARHINFNIIKNSLTRVGELTCIFGSMKKRIINEFGEILTVKPTVVRRLLCRNRWWQQSKRVFLTEEDENDVFALSYPVGYYYVEGSNRKVIDIENQKLNLLATYI